MTPPSSSSCLERLVLCSEGHAYNCVHCSRRGAKSAYHKADHLRDAIRTDHRNACTQQGGTWSCAGDRDARASARPEKGESRVFFGPALWLMNHLYNTYSAAE